VEYEDPRLNTCEAKIKVLLFDLGGVLLRLRDPIETFGLPISLNEFKALWLQLSSVREFEAGITNTEQFARKVVAESNMPYGWQEFIERFDAWPDQLFDRTLPVLRAIPDEYQCALLSNINALHWGRKNISGPLEGCFDEIFLSYQEGLVKPEREFYALVTERFACQPDEVLFFDDSPGNIAAASEFGMHAALAIGIEAVETSLRDYGILPQA
jgi:HAD superfamily hydrolase (TIGR01509 family)